MTCTRLETWVVGAMLGSALCLGACDKNSGTPMGPTSGSGVNESPVDTDPDHPTNGPTDEPLVVPVGRSVVWKRAAVVERDLMRALELPKETLCLELGSLSCTETHLAALGGNEPFEKNQYLRIPEPSALTPVALDRLVMGACAARVAADRSGDPKVFTSFSLDRPTGPKDADFLKSLDAQHVALFRRLVARDPSADELTELRALAHDEAGAPIAGADLATLSCFVIGTHAELAFL